MKRIPVAIITLLATLVALTAGAAECGGEGQAACTVAPAVFVQKKALGCPKGAFFDPIDGGSCWSCPAGYSRTLEHVKSAKACRNKARTVFAKATRHGRGTGLLRTDCRKGQFWDPNGYCWSCPGGYGRTTQAVTSAKACSKRVAGGYARANASGGLKCPSGSFFDPIDGGGCWRCPKGYKRSLSSVKARDACTTTALGGLGKAFGACPSGLVNINGICSRKGDCGGRGQRPCLLGERTPSCNRGLKEDFKRNRCVTLRPGETPFMGGLASLTQVYGDVITKGCQGVLGNLRISAQTDLAVGANCAKDVIAGAACRLLADKAGAGYASTASSLLGSGAAAARLDRELSAAYAGTQCARYAEGFARARRHGRGTGALRTDCGPGQFWDPNGYCYSCPRNYTRTLYPVTDARACVDKPGSELARLACASYTAVDRMMGDSARCSIEILESGRFIDRKLDFSLASREVCMSTGEFAYTVLNLASTINQPREKKADELANGLTKLINKIKRSDMYRRGTILAAGAGAARQGTSMMGKIDDLRYCHF